jgi:type I restriction enzyme S subunit
MTEAPPWASATIGQLLNFKYGKALASQHREADGRYPVLGSAGHMTATHTPLVSETAVIVGRKGNVGAIQLEAGGCWPIDTTYYATVPKEFEPRFLYHQLASMQLEHLDSSTATPSLRREDLEAQALVIPPLDEQRRIVDILEDHLSRLDAAMQMATNAERRLISLRRSGLERDFAVDHAASVPLGELAQSVQAGKSFGGASHPAVEDQWGIVKVSAMTWGDFKAAENKAVSDLRRVDPRFEIRAGDLLVSRANTSEYVGASVLVGPGVRSKLLLSDKSLRVLPKPGVDPEWMLRALQAPSARRQISDLATGTKDSMRNISQSALLSVRVPRADRDAQRQAIERFRELELAVYRLGAEVNAAETRAAALRRALLAAAFSGHLNGNLGDLDRVEEMASP